MLYGLPDSSAGKESACNAGDLGSIPGLGRFSGEGKATHSSILAWRIPRTIQSMGLQRVRHNLVPKQQQPSSLGKVITPPRLPCDKLRPDD